METKFYLNMIVWGEAYTNLFLKVTLPTLLAAGNLPALSKFGRCCFTIYTHKSDESTMMSCDAFRYLSTIVDIEFVDIEQEQSRQNTWFTMTTCHNRAIANARKNSAFAVFIIPDHVYSHNSFETAINAIKQGYKGVLVLQLPAIRDSFLEELLPTYCNAGLPDISISPDNLLELWHRHKHPGSDFFLWNSRHFPNDSPCLLGWQTGNNSFVIRSSQFTPLMLLPETDFQLPTDGPSVYTLDTVLAKKLILNQSEVYIVQDSDQGIQIDMRPLSQDYTVSFDRPNIPMIACHLNWFSDHGNGNLEYMERPLFYHYAEGKTDHRKIDEANAIYNMIKQLASFDTAEQFKEKLAAYFWDLVQDRSVAILGNGYLADITHRFVGIMGFRSRVILKIEELQTNEYLFLADEPARLETVFFQLSVNALKHELDFMVTPLAYRQFRQMFPAPLSFSRFYHDYYLEMKKNGIQWTLKVILNKLRHIY